MFNKINLYIKRKIPFFTFREAKLVFGIYFVFGNPSTRDARQNRFALQQQTVKECTPHTHAKRGHCEPASGRNGMNKTRVHLQRAKLDVVHGARPKAP